MIKDIENVSKTEVCERLVDTWEHLRSAYAIAERKGIDTNWEAFQNKTLETIKKIVETFGLEPKMPNMVVTPKTFRFSLGE